MTDTITDLDNPYWEAVLNVENQPAAYGMTGVNKLMLARHDLVDQYAWTITDPATVAFVAEHAGPRVLDPLAGTGYWAHLLGQHGVDVHASDLNPPGSDGNHWHRAGVTYAPIEADDAVDSTRAHGHNRTLLLSWPPYDNPLGWDIVHAYQGDRIVYIGEGWGGCCGDDGMFRLFECDWVEVARHAPVQYMGMHDFVTVYDRR